MGTLFFFVSFLDENLQALHNKKTIPHIEASPSNPSPRNFRKTEKFWPLCWLFTHESFKSISFKQIKTRITLTFPSETMVGKKISKFSKKFESIFFCVCKGWFWRRICQFWTWGGRFWNDFAITICLEWWITNWKKFETFWKKWNNLFQKWVWPMNHQQMEDFFLVFRLFWNPLSTWFWWKLDTNKKHPVNVQEINVGQIKNLCDKETRLAKFKMILLSFLREFHDREMALWNSSFHVVIYCIILEKLREFCNFFSTRSFSLEFKGIDCFSKENWLFFNKGELFRLQYFEKNHFTW